MNKNKTKNEKKKMEMELEELNRTGPRAAYSVTERRNERPDTSVNNYFDDIFIKVSSERDERGRNNAIVNPLTINPLCPVQFQLIKSNACL